MILHKLASYPTSLMALLLAAFFTCSCEDKQLVASLASVEEELAELEKTKSKLETTLKSEKTASENRQRELLKQNEELQKTSDELKAQFEGLEDQLAQAKQELRDYTAQYKAGARAKLKGMTVPRLETADNATFERVTVREVTAEEASFSHAAGISRVPLAKLPRDLQQKFLYDPEEVKEMEQARAAAAAAAEGTEQGEGVMAEELAKVKQKDPSREVNPIVVMNLKKRIVTRQQQIKKSFAEADQVRKSGYGDTNLGKYRLQVLGNRVKKLQGEIKVLITMLNKELNG